MKRIGSFFLLSLISSFVLNACASEEGMQSNSRLVSSGEEIFAEKCGMCHRDRGMGTGILARRMEPAVAELENRNDLQGAYIEAVVRNGLNNMFPLGRIEVSDAQLAKIIDHLEK